MHHRSRPVRLVVSSLKRFAALAELGPRNRQNRQVPYDIRGKQVDWIAAGGEGCQDLYGLARIAAQEFGVNQDSSLGELARPGHLRRKHVRKFELHARFDERRHSRVELHRLLGVERHRGSTGGCIVGKCGVLGKFDVDHQVFQRVGSLQLLALLATKDNLGGKLAHGGLGRPHIDWLSSIR